MFISLDVMFYVYFVVCGECCWVIVVEFSILCIICSECRDVRLFTWVCVLRCLSVVYEFCACIGYSVIYLSFRYIILTCG